MEAIDPQFLYRLLGFYAMGESANCFKMVAERLELPKGSLSYTDYNNLLTKKEVREFAALFKKYGLLRSADILLEHARSRHSSLEEILPELQRSIRRELCANLFLFIPESKRQFIEDKQPFGEQVSTAFPSAIYDIEEAGKCLGLARSTACLFHLMRVMEVGLKVVARELGIPYAPSWESYLKQITNLINRDWKDKEPEWKTNESLFRELLGDLQTVKIAWRNPTMHIVRTYTEEEAGQVYGAVRMFMLHLAKSFGE